MLNFIRVPPTPLSKLSAYTINKAATTQCLTDVEVEAAVNTIYDLLLKTEEPARRFLSLDIEWASKLKKPGKRCVDLIQLAVQDCVFLIRTHTRENSLAPSLAHLLGNATIMKVSAGINGTNNLSHILKDDLTEVIGS